MLTLKWLIGLICLLYPSRVEGTLLPRSPRKGGGPETPRTERIKDMVHAEQIA